MNITFNNITTAIRKNPEGLYSLTDIEKAWLASGGTGGQLRNWKDSEDCQRILSEIQLVSTEGRNGGTWGCKRAVILYASHCDVLFQLAVIDAFAALTEGKPLEAAAIAESVAVSDELIALHDTKRQEMNVAITSSGINMKGQEYSNFYKLAVKAATGCTPAVLTNRNGTAKDYIKEAEHPECLNAVIASMELITKCLRLGQTYHEIAFMLDVKTTKNGELYAVNDAIYKEVA